MRTGDQLPDRRPVPYLLLAPGLLCLAIFFVYPAIQMFLVSLWTGRRPERLPADMELGHLR